MDLDPCLELPPGLGPEAVAIDIAPRHRLETLGVAGKGRNTVGDVADNAGAVRGRGIALRGAAHALRAGPVAPRAKYHRHAIGEADLVLQIDPDLVLIDIGADRVRRRQAATEIGQRGVIDGVDIDHLERRAAHLADRIEAVVDARQQRVFDARPGGEIELQVVVGREDLHPRHRPVGIEGDAALVGVEIGVGGVRIAVRVMREIGHVAVDVAGLQIEPGGVAEALFEQGGALQQTAVVAVPAGLADEQVVAQLAVGIGQQRADQREELRCRAAVVLLIQPEQRQLGVGRWLEGDRGGHHHPVVGDVIGLGTGIAHPHRKPRGDRIAQRAGDVDQRFLAVERSVAQRGLARGGEFGALGHQVDDPAQRALAEQHRGRAAHQFDLIEIVRIGADAGVIVVDVAHAVAELQRVDAAHQRPVDAAVGAVGIGRDARDVVERVADADRTLREIEFVVDHRDRLRGLEDRNVGLGRAAALIARAGDHDFARRLFRAGIFGMGGASSDGEGEECAAGEQARGVAGREHEWFP